MIKKTVAIGFDVMSLGAALAVIRCNDGFRGICSLYKILGIEITKTMQDYFSKLDLGRVINSSSVV